MKKFKRTWLAGAVLGVLAGAAAAQTGQTGNPPPERDPYPTPTQTKPEATAPAQSADKDMAPITTSTPTPASKLLGKNVNDTAGKKFGDLKDLVADSTGLIAIVERSSDGQLVGMPMTSLTAQGEAKDAKESANPKVKEFTLKGGTEKMSSAPIINEVKNVDAAWMSRVRDHFGGKSTAMGGQPGETKPGTEPTGERPTPGGEPGGKYVSAVFCAKDFIGKDLKNSKGEDIGKVEDLAVDVSGSKVAYVVVASGGVMGMGETLHGVPLNSFSLDAAGKNAVLSTDKATLEKTPGIDKDHLPTHPDIQVSATAQEGARPVAQEPKR
jgi:sporulation protein YlmC with PRC-barrel domain